MEIWTLLAIEPFQPWLRIYIFTFGKIDGEIFHDESFMMEVPAGSPLKTDNVIKRMDRTPFIFSAKINFFITYTDNFLQKSHVNSTATDVAFRENLLKLNSRKHQINFPLWLFYGHVQGPFCYKFHIAWFFYLTRDWSKNDVSAMQGLLLEIILFAKSISAWLTKNYTLFYKQHCLNTAQ